MVVWHMAIKERRRLRFSWHKKKPPATMTYCGLLVRLCSLVNHSSHLCDVEANQCNKSREAELLMRMTLTEDRRLRTKPRISEELENYLSEYIMYQNRPSKVKAKAAKTSCIYPPRVPNNVGHDKLFNFPIFSHPYSLAFIYVHLPASTFIYVHLPSSTLI